MDIIIEIDGKKYDLAEAKDLYYKLKEIFDGQPVITTYEYTWQPKFPDWPSSTCLTGDDV